MIASKIVCEGVNDDVDDAASLAPNIVESLSLSCPAEYFFPQLVSNHRRTSSADVHQTEMITNAFADEDPHVRHAGHVALGKAIGGCKHYILNNT